MITFSIIPAEQQLIHIKRKNSPANSENLTIHYQLLTNRSSIRPKKTLNFFTIHKSRLNQSPYICLYVIRRRSTYKYRVIDLTTVSKHISPQSHALGAFGKPLGEQVQGKIIMLV
jgi:hypothetical protein